MLSAGLPASFSSHPLDVVQREGVPALPEVRADHQVGTVHARRVRDHQRVFVPYLGRLRPVSGGCQRRKQKQDSAGHFRKLNT